MTRCSMSQRLGNIRMRRPFLRVIVSSVLLVASLVSIPSRPAAAAVTGDLLRSSPLELPDELVSAGATGYRIRYLSTSAKGGPTEVTGVVLLPPGTAPPGGWPVVSWAHGTTGISDRCTPSRDTELGGYGYAGYLAGLVRRGFVVAATDYEGLGTPGAHPYLIAESQGRSVVDAVRAAGDLDRRVSGVWLAVGHSQGGHAAMAAGEIASHYGRGLDFRGTVALAPITDNRPYVDRLARLKPIDHGYFMAILAGLATWQPKLRYADYLGSRALKEFPRVHTTCIEELTNRLVKLNLPGAEFAPNSTGAAERLRKWLGANAVPRMRSRAPLFVAQGLADYLVPAEQTKLAVRKAKALGTDAKMVGYPNVGHYEITEASAPDVLRWIEARVR